MPKAFERPAAIHVYATVKPTKRNGLTTPHTSRVGVCKREDEIPALIAEDRKAMGQTFGGLIEPVGLEGRSYRAFRAVWEEIALVK